MLMRGAMRWTNPIRVPTVTGARLAATCAVVLFTIIVRGSTLGLVTRRTPRFGEAIPAQAISGRAGGRTLQGFGERGDRIGEAGSHVEPFVGAAVLRLRRDGFTETGGRRR